MKNKLFFRDCDTDFFYDYVFFEDDVPILFSCKNGNDKKLYLTVLCDDRNELRWIMTKTDYNFLNQMMNNEKTMREVFVESSNEYYIIIEKESKKTVVKGTIEIVDELDFPVENCYFEADSDEINDFQHYYEREKQSEYAAIIKNEIKIDKTENDFFNYVLYYNFIQAKGNSELKKEHNKTTMSQPCVCIG
ncbi:MAG: hypothetical protein PHD70_02515 [Anaerostipes sp.]|nr:hypothetical protein [Anaerostipes sp.]MDD3745330.1 hypothetical protein [Anaerostipes sp.]